jgi:hypothetical protein
LIFEQLVQGKYHREKFCFAVSTIENAVGSDFDMVANMV